MLGTSRFWRTIFNTLTVLSMLLMLGVIGLWVDSQRSTFVCSMVIHPGSFDGPIVVESDFEGISFANRVVLLNSQYQWRFLWFRCYYVNRIDRFIFKLFSTRSEYWGFSYSQLKQDSSVTVPHWFLALLLAILPAIWLYKWRNHRKLGPNACSSCGYNLTGNETGHFRGCPECGAANEIPANPANPANLAYNKGEPTVK